MNRVALVSWAVDRDDRARLLPGHDVTIVAPPGPSTLRPVLDKPPDVFVIDLDRRPSEGSPWVFGSGSGRQRPGAARLCGRRARERRARAATPSGRGLHRLGRDRCSVESARAPADPVVPGTMEAYSGTDLTKNLGVKEGTTVALLGALDGFHRSIGAPAEADPADVVLLFVRSQADLDERLTEADARWVQGPALVGLGPYSGVQVWTVRAGKLARLEVYLDTPALLDAIDA